jgi:mannose-6-phosphate isomerase-like protein (cupin superfamily)
MSRTLLLVSLALIPGALVAQTPPAQTPAPVARRPVAPAVATSLVFKVTDSVGTPLPDVRVATLAPVARDGVTSRDGSLLFTNMRAGTYRVRFTRDGSITLERDIVVRNGESLVIDVSLNAAPAPPKAPEPVKPTQTETPKALPPPGEPKVTAVPLFLEKNFINRDPRKDSPLGCTPTGTATLHQLREAWLNHSNTDADEWIYVVAGEGTIRIGTNDQRVTAGTFTLIPRTITHALLPSGRNPFIVISVLSGPPCIEPK